MRIFVASCIAAVTGFVALSYEILWYRTYSFISHNAPETFGFLLGAYLLGLALGAQVARHWCRPAGPAGEPPRLTLVAGFLAAASVGGFLAIPIAARGLSILDLPDNFALWVFGAAAILFGTTLPLISHYAIPADLKVGRSLSYVYLANIAGSAAGSILTGLWLLDVWPLAQVSLLLVMLGLGLSITIFAATLRMYKMAAAVTVCGVLVTISSGHLHGSLYERLHSKDRFNPGEKFALVHEGRAGVVTVTRTGTVYGNGSYDGQFNVDVHPERDVNRVLRAYRIPGFLRQPKDILFIGLGSGSWVRVLAEHPEVKSITVVEINGGYQAAVASSSVVSGILDHPKVQIIVDDGRRFLRRTDQKFDLIVQNTIAHWHNFASNLLSREYLELSATRLAPNGYVYLNTTSSAAAQKTAASVFPYATRYQNMMIAGFTPIVFDQDRFFASLRSWRVNDRQVLDANFTPEVLDLLVTSGLWRGVPTEETRADLLTRTIAQPLITDDNLATEWWAKAKYP